MTNGFSVRLSSFARRAFSVAGPSVWNSLPEYLRDPAVGKDSYRKQLKTFLFATEGRLGDRVFWSFCAPCLWFFSPWRLTRDTHCVRGLQVIVDRYTQILFFLYWLQFNTFSYVTVIAGSGRYSAHRFWAELIFRLMPTAIGSPCSFMSHDTRHRDLSKRNHATATLETRQSLGVRCVAYNVNRVRYFHLSPRQR